MFSSKWRSIIDFRDKLDGLNLSMTNAIDFSTSHPVDALMTVYSHTLCESTRSYFMASLRIEVWEVL